MFEQPLHGRMIGRGEECELDPVACGQLGDAFEEEAELSGNGFGLFPPFLGLVHLPPVATGCARWAP